MTPDWLSIAAGVLVLVWTVLPLSRSPRWWVRAFEFPRAQLAALGLCMALGVWWRTGLGGVAEQIAFAVILACTAYQLLRILPYRLYFPLIRRATRSTKKQG